MLPARRSGSRLTEQLRQRVMNLFGENVELTARAAAAESAAAAASSGAASSHVDKMVALGGKMYAKPQNPAELLLRFKKDAKNMKESRRKQKKTLPTDPVQ